MDNEKSLHVSIIMPALNEEENIYSAITETLEAFELFSLDGEIVVVNDGSTDNTENIVETLMRDDSRVRYLKHSEPKGIGASFWDGVDLACGDTICMLPGDNENDPNEILQYFKLLNAVDIVIPFAFNKWVRPLYRNALSYIFRFIINTTFLVNFNYTNGTLLYRKSILKDLKYRSKGFFFQTDILVRLVKKGYLFAEVPYKLGQRNSGESKAVSFPSLWQVSAGYLRLLKDFHYLKDLKKNSEYTQDSLTAKRNVDR